MLASGRNGTLYIGVTNDIARRTWEHRNGEVEGFTKKYGVHILVWYEMHGDVHAAIAREKQLKGWNRAWKIRMIEKKFRLERSIRQNAGRNCVARSPAFQVLTDAPLLSSPARRAFAAREGDPGIEGGRGVTTLFRSSS
jgi:putative endonuclease